MTTAPSEENVEQTKRHIRGLVNEISELSKSETPAGEYYPAVLQRIVSALAAVGGAIWLMEEDGSLRLAHQIQMAPNLMQSGNEDTIQHGRLLSRLIMQGKPELVPPLSGTGDDGEGNPTRYLLVTAPLASTTKPVGLVEILQRPDSPTEAQRGYLRFLDHMSKLMSEWIKGHTLQQVSNRQELWQQSDQFARLVHDNLDIRDTAFTIANEGRRLIECDRVSVAILKGGKARVVAISGQDTIENRSNTVQSLNNLATRVVRSGEPLWYDGSTEDLPPQIEDAIEDYVDLSHGRTVTVLPIRQPERKIEGDVLASRNETSETRQRRDIIGALIVEQIETQLSRSVLEGRVDLVYEHSCRAMSNSMAHSQILFMPVWRFLDRSLWMFRGSALPKTLSIIGLIGLGIGAMFVIPVDFDLEGNGSLKASTEVKVFAHVNGQVESIFVEHGQKVKEHQPLVQMKDPDLELQMRQVQGDIEASKKQLDLLDRALQQPGNKEVDLQRYTMESEQQRQTIANHESQLKLLREKEDKLVRRSPIQGIVTTWDVERTLTARPVVTGQELMKVANPDGGWEVEVLLPEKRMRYLDYAFATTKENYLPVEFILMTDPETKHKGKLFLPGVSLRAEMEAEDGAVVKLRCIPDPEAMEKISRRPGARVIADVKCGKRSAAFVWFHEPVEWVRAHVLF